MARQRVHTQDFSRGLQTRANEDGQPLSEFKEFRNARVRRAVTRRPGWVLMDRVTISEKCYDLNGSSEYFVCPRDPRVWTLPLKFTLTIGCSPDSTSNMTLLYAGVSTPCLVIDISSSKWRVRIWDSVSTLTTLTSSSDAVAGLQALALVRDGANLTLRVNGVTEATGTMTATNKSLPGAGNVELGRDGASAYFDGKIDYLRIETVPVTGNVEWWVRNPHPRAKTIIADYIFRSNLSQVFWDRSRFENHMTSSAVTLAASLCTAAPMVQGLGEYRDSSGAQRLILAAGGRLYPGAMS